MKIIEKNIANQQKRYASLFTQLENQAKTLQTNANMFFQNMSGLGCGSVNPMDYTGLNGFVTNFMGNMLVNQGVQLTKDGTPHKMESTMYQNVMVILLFCPLYNHILTPYLLLYMTDESLLWLLVIFQI